MKTVESKPKIAADIGGPINKKSPKKASKSSSREIPLKSSVPESVDSSKGKTVQKVACNLGCLTNLCNPVEIAPVHNTDEDLFEHNFLPVLKDISSADNFFHRMLQHCIAARSRGSNVVLVSQPFKSLKE